jgi:hypothetical protein
MVIIDESNQVLWLKEERDAAVCDAEGLKMELFAFARGEDNAEDSAHSYFEQLETAQVPFLM